MSCRSSDCETRFPSPNHLSSAAVALLLGKRSLKIRLRRSSFGAGQGSGSDSGSGSGKGSTERVKLIGVPEEEEEEETGLIGRGRRRKLLEGEFLRRVERGIFLEE